MTEPTTLALTGAAVLVVLGLVVALLRIRRQTSRALDRAAEERAALVARLEELERAGTAPRTRAEAAEFVITDVGAAPAADPAPVASRIEGRLFADLVLRESVVKAAAWGHGVRRVLSPEVRSRLRSEMRRETKRSARRRKADVREALRQYYARERGDVA